jgi:hypothetical protein
MTNNNLNTSTQVLNISHMLFILQINSEDMFIFMMNLIDVRIKYDFKPERFLENGKYLALGPIAFISFGTGCRMCLGEKLAINDVFLVFVRLLQSTNGYEISLKDGPGSAHFDSGNSMRNIFPPKKI